MLMNNSPIDPTWSPDLQTKLAQLTPKQRTAILVIVQGEASRLPLTQLLKTAYSCLWCGRVMGRTGESRESRKSRLVLHEMGCETEGGRWAFAATAATYYGVWLREGPFAVALALARVEMTQQALRQAANLLQLGTTAAASELIRQVDEGRTDVDRRAAAIAILDRADISTATKRAEDEKLSDWLEELSRWQIETESETARDVIP